METSNEGPPDILYVVHLCMMCQEGGPLCRSSFTWQVPSEPRAFCSSSDCVIH